jgi:hypothetical protein
MTIVDTESGSLPLRVGGVPRADFPADSLGYHHEGTSWTSPPLELETGA